MEALGSFYAVLGCYCCCAAAAAATTAADLLLSKLPVSLEALQRTPKSPRESFSVPWLGFRSVSYSGLTTYSKSCETKNMKEKSKKHEQVFEPRADPEQTPHGMGEWAQKNLPYP